MPIPQLTIEDRDRGLPRQPVPLRLACLVVGWDCRSFLSLFYYSSIEDPSSLLQGYEFAKDANPRTVQRDFYRERARRIPRDAPEKEALALLPVNHFVWSDELAATFSLFVDEFHEREDAARQGIGLSWNPALHGSDGLIAECLDLGALSQKIAPASLTPRDLRKLETSARHERWRQAYGELKQEHPGKSDSWIALRIENMPIAEGRDSETIRRNMKRK